MTLALFCQIAGARTDDVALENSIQSAYAINGAGADDLKKIEPGLLVLSYTQQRIFRALCHLKGIKVVDLPILLEISSSYSVPFVVIPLFERGTMLEGATLENCRILLNTLAEMSFVQAQAIAALLDLQPKLMEDMLRLVKRMENLNESGLWAAKTLVVRRGIGVAEVADCLEALSTMNRSQQRAAEQLFLLESLKNRSLFGMLQRLGSLSQIDASNVEALFRQRTITETDVLFWLDEYFLLPIPERQTRFLQLNAARKITLLHAFADAAETQSRRVNNLHDITDQFGYEISTRTLASRGPGEIHALFLQLHAGVVDAFTPLLTAALQRNDLLAAIAVLRKATTASRQAFAADLAEVNIYVLLARAATLYDSSFRDILVPVLLERLRRSGGGDFLSFMQAIDPQQEYIADCVINLGRTGKLPGFLPTNSERQGELVDLMIGSALRDQCSLLLFSVSLSRMLPMLLPQSRNRLIDALLSSTERLNHTAADQVQVIVQWYLSHFPKLLTSGEKEKISSLISRRGAIDVAPFIGAPFAEWLTDRDLRALSVFQQDEDGRKSYLVNCISLLQNGYHPVLSSVYRPRILPELVQQEVEAEIRSISRSPQISLNGLFEQSCRTPLVIDWHKSIGGVELVQSIHVFHSVPVQEELLATFLSAGHEMFAQRGHSYWREDQLFGPIEALVGKKKITAAQLTGKQRLVCLGSCGGIRAYTRLNQLFAYHIDLLATIGMGRMDINTPYNRQLFEIIATHPTLRSWQELMSYTTPIFASNSGSDYIQPGSLPSILYKMAGGVTER